jgi:hypothetical protein
MAKARISCSVRSEKRFKVNFLLLIAGQFRIIPETLPLSSSKARPLREAQASACLTLADMPAI